MTSLDRGPVLLYNASAALLRVRRLVQGVWFSIMVLDWLICLSALL